MVEARHWDYTEASLALELVARKQVLLSEAASKWFFDDTSLEYDNPTITTSSPSEDRIAELEARIQRLEDTIRRIKEA